jgi:hypothetical protein
MEAKNEMSRTRFCGKRKAQSTRDARSRIACWWTVDEEPQWHRIAGIALRDRQTEGRVLCRGSSRVEERSQREKQCPRRGLGGSISHGKMDISSVPTAPAAVESSPESPILSRDRVASLSVLSRVGMPRPRSDLPAWNDIDFKAHTYHVRKRDDVGFSPKTHESRTIELPASLIRELKERREKQPHDRFVFLSKQGKPDNHFLRKLKKIALRGGLNCGQCKTTITVGEYKGKKRVEVSCKTHPVCEHYILHRFRKTCATCWLQSGATLRDIQLLLGHKSLATTQKYLGATVSAKLRPIIDRAFGD